MDFVTLFVWLFCQLASYSLLTWLAWVGIAYGCARYGGLAGMFAGHCVVAVLVFLLDLRWVRAAMAAPGWDGAPDMDVVFSVGWVVRVVLINSVLLLITGWALRIRRRHRVPPSAPEITAA